MKLKAIKQFSWAHGGHSVKEYEAGQEIDTDEVCTSETDAVDFERVTVEEGWTQEAAAADKAPAAKGKAK